MDDQEQELERKLERALDALVWGRRQPDFSSNDRTKLLSDVTDARIELWEYHRSAASSHGGRRSGLQGFAGPRRPTRGRLDHAVTLGERFVAHLDLPIRDRGPRVRILLPPPARWYGAGGEEMAPSSLQLTDGVP